VHVPNGSRFVAALEVGRLGGAVLDDALAAGALVDELHDVGVLDLLNRPAELRDVEVAAVAVHAQLEDVEAERVDVARLDRDRAGTGEVEHRRQRRVCLDGPLDVLEVAGERRERRVLRGPVAAALLHGGRRSRRP
jgi:hypothetical protein